MGIFSFSSCEDITTEDQSKVTVFIDEVNLVGDEYLAVPMGGTFTDPGATASMNGEDISDQIVIASNVNLGKAGMYAINYSAINEDGFAKTVTRNVIVYDPTPSDIESGLYMTTASSYRFYGGAELTYGKNFPVVIYQVSPGKFFVTDFLAGWYQYRAGYGYDYAIAGYFTYDSGTFTLGSNVMNGGWADSLIDWKEASYDTATGQMKWTSQYVSGMLFYITLNKN